MPKQSPKITLQQALKDLEKIVESLNSKDLDVEEGMEQFKKGVELIQFCRGQLKAAENKFQELKAKLEDENEE